MISLEKAIVVRLKTFGENFEILVDPDQALAFREGANISLDNVLAAKDVFKDAKAGDRASDEVMKKIFKTDDHTTAITEILKKGELHLTTEQKKKMLDERRKQIVDAIARNAINPQTRAPHPAARIDKALDEAKFEVVVSKSAKEQVEKALKAITPLIPIRFEKIDLAIKVPAQYSGGLFNAVKEYGEIKKDEWVGGDQYLMIEIPGGLQDELFSRLNSLTHGEVKIKILGKDKNA